MNARQLEVRINDQLLGHLREENDLWQFDYAEPWAASADAFDLSPALPRSQRLHADGASLRPVQWYFDNLLPEEALRDVIAKEAGLKTEDAFGLLAYFGAESAGSLVLREPGNDAPIEYGLKPLSLADLNMRILNLPSISLTRDAPKHMSLAGAQHKMLVVFKRGKLFEPLAGTPSPHILKPDHPGDYPASVMNEYFTMRLAAALGLEVPPVYRLYAPQPVYIIERFDRIATNTKSEKNSAMAAKANIANIADAADNVQRVHIVDTCQLLNKARNFKYSAAHLETLAQAIACCRSKAAARMQLYRWLVFNILVGNGDNHLKNISFRVGAAGINVAPAYDLLSTAVYDTAALADERARWPDTPLAFSVGDTRTFADVRRGHILDAASALGLNKATALRELERMLKATPMAADKLVAEIENSIGKAVDICPDPGTARTIAAGELRMLRAIRHIVIAGMCGQLV